MDEKELDIWDVSIKFGWSNAKNEYYLDGKRLNIEKIEVSTIINGVKYEFFTHKKDRETNISRRCSLKNGMITGWNPIKPFKCGMYDDGECMSTTGDCEYLKEE